MIIVLLLLLLLHFYTTLPACRLRAVHGKYINSIKHLNNLKKVQHFSSIYPTVTRCQIAIPVPGLQFQGMAFMLHFQCSKCFICYYICHFCITPPARQASGIVPQIANRAQRAHGLPSELRARFESRAF